MIGFLGGKYSEKSSGILACVARGMQVARVVDGVDVV